MVESFDYASVGSTWYQKECYRTDSQPVAMSHLPCPIIPRAAHKARPEKVLLPKATLDGLDGLDGVEVTAQVGKDP